MKSSIASFVVGVLFALGLGLSGMTQPQKVVGFLNIFGEWDASLLFVMVGAISIHFFSYRWIIKRPSPLLSPKWMVPDKNEITPALVVGSLLFGMGWGLAGYCPGPAITSLASFDARVFVFVGSLFAGMAVFNWTNRYLKFRR